jgi:hypothetical protein
MAIKALIPARKMKTSIFPPTDLESLLRLPALISESHSFIMFLPLDLVTLSPVHY